MRRGAPPPSPWSGHSRSRESSRISADMIRISDPALARRAKRQLLGLASYLMFLLPLAYAVHNGWMRFGYRGLGVFVLVAVLVNVGFLVAIGSGFSRRFSDPGLVTAQVVAAVLMGLGIDAFVD